MSSRRGGRRACTHMYIHERAVHTNTYTQPPRRRPSRRTRTTRSLALRAPLAGSRPRRSPRRRPRRSVRRRRRETAARTRGSPSARRAAWDRKPGTGGTDCRRRWLRPGIQGTVGIREKGKYTVLRFVYEKFTVLHPSQSRAENTVQRSYARFCPHRQRSLLQAGRGNVSLWRWFVPRKSLGRCIFGSPSATWQTHCARAGTVRSRRRPAG